MQSPKREITTQLKFKYEFYRVKCLYKTTGWIAIEGDVPKEIQILERGVSPKGMRVSCISTLSLSLSLPHFTQIFEIKLKLMNNKSMTIPW